MIYFGLWILATLDAAFAGYRAAAGRCGLIDKRRYYQSAMLRGAGAGQLAVALTAVMVLVSLALSLDRQLLLCDYHRAGAGMLIVYVPYAVVLLIAFLFRLIPSVDIRSITSTVIFGPFTLIRPLMAIAGLVYGVSRAPRIETFVLGVIVLTMMLSLERGLSLWQKFPARLDN
jgi:hypothetical protein